MSAIPFDQLAKYGLPIVSSIASPLERTSGRVLRYLRRKADEGAQWAAEVLANRMETIPERASFMGAAKRMARYGRADITDYRQSGSNLVRPLDEGGADVVAPYGYTVEYDPMKGVSYTNKITKRRVHQPDDLGIRDTRFPADPDLVRNIPQAVEKIKTERRGLVTPADLTARNIPDPRIPRIVSAHPSPDAIHVKHGEPVTVRVYRASVMGGSIPGRGTFYTTDPNVALSYFRQQREAAEKYYRGRELTQVGKNIRAGKGAQPSVPMYTERGYRRIEGRPARQAVGLSEADARVWKELPAHSEKYPGTSGYVEPNASTSSLPGRYQAGRDARTRRRIKEDIRRLGDTGDEVTSGPRPIHEDVLRHIEQADLRMERPFVAGGPNLPNEFGYAAEPADLFVTMSDAYNKIKNEAHLNGWTPQRFQEEVRKRADPWGLVDGKKFKWKDVERLDANSPNAASLSQVGGVYRYADKLFTRMMREHGYDGAIFPQSQYLIHLGEASELTRGPVRGMEALSAAERKAGAPPVPQPEFRPDLDPQFNAGMRVPASMQKGKPSSGSK